MLRGRLCSSSFKETRDKYRNTSRIGSFDRKNAEAISKGNSATWIGVGSYLAQDVFISIEACTKANLTLNKAHTLDDTKWHHLKKDLYADSCTVLLVFDWHHFENR